MLTARSGRKKGAWKNGREKARYWQMGPRGSWLDSLPPGVEEYLSGMSVELLMITRRKAGMGFAPESLVAMFRRSLL